MSARDGPEYDELDVRRSDAPRELAEADRAADPPQLVSIDEARHLAYAEQRQRALNGGRSRDHEEFVYGEALVRYTRAKPSAKAKSS